MGSTGEIIGFQAKSVSINDFNDISRPLSIEL